MKKVKLVLLLCGIIGIMAFSCNKEKNTDNNFPCLNTYETVQTLNNVLGTIGFDSINMVYFIDTHVEGTIDELITAYPCILPEEFQKIALTVKFSGELFERNDLPKPVIGGQRVFYINLTNIKLNQ
jgi:hypothetical protein